jgi:hypothetical protein
MISGGVEIGILLNNVLQQNISMLEEIVIA